MCFSIYLSTTSDEDLSKLNDGPFFFLRPGENDDVQFLALLEHANQWFLSCQYGGCSCHFRHREGVEPLGFGLTLDWFPEDDDDLESTKAVYDVLSRLVSEGHKLDLLDVWEGYLPSEIKARTVSLHEVSRDEFAFFEQCRFIFVP
ncbi:MAG: hypothetical protein IH945_09705 [Armatimonadetes bacterium]|nr:hypothetical protein [Armatimonadota bacterium]